MNVAAIGFQELSDSEMFEFNGGVNWGMFAIGAVATVAVVAVYVTASIVTNGAAAAPLAKPTAYALGTTVGLALTGLAL